MQEFYFALVAPLGLNSPLLTYKISQVCKPYDIVEIDLKQKRLIGVVVKLVGEVDSELQKKCKLAEKSEQNFLPFQKLLAEFIASYYCASFSQTFALFIPQKSAQISQGAQIPQKSAQIQPFALPTLSPKQQEALNHALDSQNMLLFGDTGSGKTEIYMHLIAHTLLLGKNALFLMPEIALTPQIEQRLKKVFGSLVGIWHSKITHAKKRSFLDSLNNGEIRVIAGARSALFLPLQNLGQIIVDEEHDDAYKSQSTPRYNARDLALYIGKKTDIKVTLGSATPALSTYTNALKNNTLFRLKGTHFGASKSLLFSPESPLCESMIARIAEVCESQKQVIVFLPTRAHFKSLFCQDCGYKMQCKFCSVNMSVHLEKNALVCHYCGFSQAIPKLCPQCESQNLQSQRIGTQKFAKELESALPHIRIGIFDRDHITTHSKLNATLKNFNDKKIDVLVGTQMLSKGHDYHNVALCVVVGIDYVLNAIDYRANERAMSLLIQIAGRTGRKESGAVLVQSINGEFFECFGLDYELFLQNELQNRVKIYPPFMRLANLSFTHAKESYAQSQMECVLSLLQNVKKTKNLEFEIVGAKPSEIKLLKGKYRYNILLRAYSSLALRSAIMYARKNVDFSFEIDIDPLSVL